MMMLFYVTFIAMMALTACTDFRSEKHVDVKIPRSCSSHEAMKLPFCNRSLSVDERIMDLISRLHNSEKPLMLTARASPLGNVPRLNVSQYDWGLNCMHGVQSRCGTSCPTSFPNPNSLGSSFNMSLIREMGAIIGQEARSLWLQGVGENNHQNKPHIGLDCWSPSININRDPRWGRNQEVPSEDPYLTSLYAVAYTRGLQEGSDPNYLQAIVTLKHWDAYSIENWNNVTRHNFNAKVSLYDFADTYFKAFSAAIKKGKAKGVMCSYNSINGRPACASPFLKSVLRDHWKFDGYVTSDTGALQDIYFAHHFTKTPEEAAALSIKSGTDINSGYVYSDHLLNALARGLVTQNDIDQALFRTLKLRFQLGLFDQPEDTPYWSVPASVVNTAASQAFNLFATQQSLVLLKNYKRTLPFSTGIHAAVIGPHGNDSSKLLGNYFGQVCLGGIQDFSCVPSIVNEISKKNRGGFTSYAQGCAINSMDTSGFAAAIESARVADVVILALGLDQSVELVLLISGGAISSSLLKEKASAIIQAGYPGFHGATALAQVLFGEVNVGGKLAITIFDETFPHEFDMTSMDMTRSPGRTYRYYNGAPLYPFGYGLSYTSFSIATSSPFKIVLNNEDFRILSIINISVTNTGKRAGDEVVMAFFSPPPEVAMQLAKTVGGVQLQRQLFMFERVSLVPGESTMLEFPITPLSVKLVDSKGNSVSIPGVYTLNFTNGVDQEVRVMLEILGDTKTEAMFPN